MPDDTPRFPAIHDLPAEYYPITIDCFPLSDPDGAGQAVHTVTVDGAGVLAMPPLHELGQPVWLRVTYGNGQVEQMRPRTVDELVAAARTPDELAEAANVAVADAKRRIHAQGWMVQGVASSSDASGDGDMMFTVGLTEAGLPELVIIGIPRDPAGHAVAVAVLNHLARLSLADELVAGGVYPAGLDEAEVTVTDRQPGKPLSLAWLMYGRDRVRHLLIEPHQAGSR